MQTVEIFTDGGCSGNPGPGGWAYVTLADGKMLSYSSGGDPQTTNNKMELTAVIHAIEDASLLGVDSIVLSTDSQYVKNGITAWIHSWKRNGWKTASKDPVKNRELWEVLDKLNSENNIRWNWVKGHAGIKYNEMCDSLVRKEMEKFLK
ncbi:MAG: ribonuclease HI [Sphaerochaetaceae bacterium]|nr:ribonuclease HI [Sphaerochaetaceae bacterium]